ncbi:hypothetical protein VMCG_02536 [Cytospora schulzeri]|uniref:2,5-diamino-6-ribosylamino-4(3H)-pyrimidinone 5'-phosphate reductase n=1 Tax=Cytospora schulzeri TaxID=448051 RepID=A0A423X161_9PEZI|nr:hypothetical protein VMCG_02536 [Valsa malicola]
MLATSPGARTAISGSPTKAMTHFLRSRHDAILVGVGTAVADDPGLNCRLEVEMGGGHQPRPVVLDPIFGVMWEEGINSVMVEGGGMVINDLLLLANKGLDVIDSVIITIAPVWLGNGGVTVAPERPVDGDLRQVPGPRLTDVIWNQMGDDMVLCGRIMR